MGIPEGSAEGIPDRTNDRATGQARARTPDGLPTSRTEAGAAGLAALAAEPGRAVVALDFDGVLAPIVPDPDSARAHPGVVPALQQLAPLLDAVVVVTGRPAGLAVEYGGFAGAPGLEHLTILGHYGAERWDAQTGEVRAPADHPGVAALRAELPRELKRVGAPDGAWIEDKGRAIAVHTRRAEDPDGSLAALDAPLRALAAKHGLAVEPGRMVLELRPPGVDKGAALMAFLDERKARAVLYVGDDLGDVAAYDAVDDGRAVGRPGVLGYSAPTTGEPPLAALAERADLVLSGPAGVVALLEALSAALASRP
ncbi:trehalose-phosphatase [Streptacidiphilus anmyonensis]|uniref:trehalose-phosphatase n=1 Tax=Streptacidiphilus anmyonensis TaxID=405782 RepID=UPI0009FFD919|nr:trehalose-phosphatase [Streptacidiphilus anmyonensis]